MCPVFHETHQRALSKGFRKRTWRWATALSEFPGLSSEGGRACWVLVSSKLSLALSSLDLAPLRGDDNYLGFFLGGPPSLVIEKVLDKSATRPARDISFKFSKEQGCSYPKSAFLQSPVILWPFLLWLHTKSHVLPQRRPSQACPMRNLPNSFLAQASQTSSPGTSSSSPRVHVGCPRQPASLVSSPFGNGVWVFSFVSVTLNRQWLSLWPVVAVKQLWNAESCLLWTVKKTVFWV